MSDFPPEPWDLRGQLHASVFRVPVAAFPPGELDALPPGWSLVRLRGSAVVGAAWVVYEPSGVLAYRELMATVLVRRGLRVVPHVLRIWVDSEASRDGGRALWAIPKEIAAFEVSTAGGSARFVAQDPAGLIAIGTVRRVLSLPGRWPVAFSVVQRRGERDQVSPVRARSALALSRGKWIAEPFGPVGFLCGRRPLITVTLRDFVMSFGRADAARHEPEKVDAR